jgi:hypothetical protein
MILECWNHKKINIIKEPLQFNKIEGGGCD